MSVTSILYVICSSRWIVTNEYSLRQIRSLVASSVATYNHLNNFLFSTLTNIQSVFSQAHIFAYITTNCASPRHVALQVFWLTARVYLAVFLMWLLFEYIIQIKETDNMNATFYSYRICAQSSNIMSFIVSTTSFLCDDVSLVVHAIVWVCSFTFIYM